MAITARNHHAQQRSRLRLLHGRGTSAQAAAETEVAVEDRRARLRLVDECDQQGILVAASDPGRRSNLLLELSQRLPEGTRFTEAAATWEVLEHAPHSRIVMLAGELDGSSTESVMHLLGNRHPQLPVLALSAGGAA